MKTILVVANETLGGRQLLEKIKEYAAEDDIRVAICVPRSRPRHGNIIYDEAVYDAAQVRIELARSVLREEGIDAVGEPGDPDPYTATMDAVAEYHPDLIVISTFPATSYPPTFSFRSTNCSGVICPALTAARPYWMPTLSA